jgi:alginate O-acetyltransferase complex protein AlgI
MLFNSPIYIFLFLPIVVVVYFILNKFHLLVAGKIWLVLASLFFYGYWNYQYLVLIIASILVNYLVGMAIARQAILVSRSLKAKLVFTGGIVFNLGLLGYFKYADFFLANVSVVFGSEIPALNIILPLAISFFTFQQIAYLVDSYQSKVNEHSFLNYCLFVTFFPQLIAGPIVHHKEMMPQFKSIRNKLLNVNNISLGMFIFSLGLIKKILIADTFATWADWGFSNSTDIGFGFWDAWFTSLSFSFQLYYDFSAYSDMAIGVALMFNIRLPINFNSPYKSRSIQEFWRRWHITLSSWLRDYLYIPLGGSRGRYRRTSLNLIITFLLGGLWHGAGWTFIVWGAMHGFALAAHRIWRLCGFSMNAWLGLLLTFVFVNFSWVFFRADTLQQAISISQCMVGVCHRAGSGVDLIWDETFFLFLAAFSLVAFFMPNSLQVSGYITTKKHRFWSFKRSYVSAFVVAAALFYALVSGTSNAPSVFLYFNF